jgi:hypothetical protein
MSMTIEHRTYIEPKDILAFEIRCKLCQAQATYKIEKMQLDRLAVRMICPNCGTDVLLSAEDSPELNRVREFVQSLRRLIQTESRALIRLEITNEPK